MKSSILNKLQALCERHEELGLLLSDSQVFQDSNRFRQLSKEYSDLEDLTVCFKHYQQEVDNLKEAEAMLSQGDPELKAFAQEEIGPLKTQVEALEETLSLFLIPKDPFDDANIFLEVRAGTGGDEAALFAGDLCRMYMRYAERQGWSVEIINESNAEQGGYKEVVLRIGGLGAYSQMKFESGGHRVQRVPVTESQGRIHTSACTVAVLPEIAEIEQIEINPTDLRIDTYRSSGAGGQHVNKTDSAIRITHLPTGMVVECQDERSQHKNRARAMSLLQSRLLEQEREKQVSERSAERKLLVGSGDRSARIRTYNYPQARITDHRINLTIYQLSDVMEGQLELLVKPLMHEYQVEQLAEISERDQH